MMFNSFVTEKTKQIRIMSSITLKEIEGLLDEKLDKKLQPIHEKLSVIAKDLGEIRRDLGYDNLRIIKNRKEEM